MGCISWIVCFTAYCCRVSGKISLRYYNRKNNRKKICALWNSVSFFLSVLQGEWEWGLAERDPHARVCGPWGWTAALYVWRGEASCSHPDIIYIYQRWEEKEDFIVTKLKKQHSMSVLFLLLSVLRSMVTATAFQILVSNNAPIKAITDNTIVTLEVSTELRFCMQMKKKNPLAVKPG